MFRTPLVRPSSWASYVPIQGRCWWAAAAKAGDALEEEAY